LKFIHTIFADCLVNSTPTPFASGVDSSTVYSSIFLCSATVIAVDLDGRSFMQLQRDKSTAAFISHPLPATIGIRTVFWLLICATPSANQCIENFPLLLMTNLMVMYNTHICIRFRVRGLSVTSETMKAVFFPVSVLHVQLTRFSIDVLRYRLLDTELSRVWWTENAGNEVRSKLSFEDEAAMYWSICASVSCAISP
jgi:hypothetical protein